MSRIRSLSYLSNKSHHSLKLFSPMYSQLIYFGLS